MMKDDILQDTVTKLADEDSYKQLFHAYLDEESLPSGEALKEIVDLCRAILFRSYPNQPADHPFPYRCPGLPAA